MGEGKSARSLQGERSEVVRNVEKQREDSGVGSPASVDSVADMLLLLPSSSAAVVS